MALVLQVRKEILEGEGDFAIVMEQLQGTSSSVKSLDDIEVLLDQSVKICLKWMRWLVDRTTGKRKRKGGREPAKWTSYLTKGRQDDDYDEDLENEYGEEVAL